MDIIKRKNLRAKKGKKDWRRNIDASQLNEVFEEQASEKVQQSISQRQKSKNPAQQQLKLDFQIDDQPSQSILKKLDPNRFKKKPIPEHLKSKNEKIISKKLLTNQSRVQSKKGEKQDFKEKQQTLQTLKQIDQISKYSDPSQINKSKNRKEEEENRHKNHQNQKKRLQQIEENAYPLSPSQIWNDDVDSDKEVKTSNKNGKRQQSSSQQPQQQQQTESQTTLSSKQKSQSKQKQLQSETPSTALLLLPNPNPNPSPSVLNNDEDTGVVPQNNITSLKQKKQKIAHVIKPGHGLSYNPSNKAYQQHISNIIVAEIEKDKETVPDTSQKKVKALKRAELNKNKRQRPKSLEKQIQFDMEEAARREKKQSHEFNLIRKFVKEINEESGKHQEKQLTKAQIMEKAFQLNKEGIVTKPQRIGRKRYEMKGPDFMLEEEFSENLRNLKPTGNLLRDQYDSIFRKGLLEVNDPMKKMKAKSRVPKYKYQDNYYTKKGEEDEWGDIEKELAVLTK